MASASALEIAASLSEASRGELLRFTVTIAKDTHRWQDAMRAQSAGHLYRLNLLDRDFQQSRRGRHRPAMAYARYFYALTPLGEEVQEIIRRSTQ